MRKHHPEFDSSKSVFHSLNLFQEENFSLTRYHLVTLLRSCLLYYVMSNLPQLREYTACTFWLESLKSKSTVDAYTIHLLLFCKFHNTDPDQLVQLNTGRLKT